MHAWNSISNSLPGLRLQLERLWLPCGWAGQEGRKEDQVGHPSSPLLRPTSCPLVVMEHSPEPAVDTVPTTPAGLFLSLFDYAADKTHFARPATPNDPGQNHDHWVT